MTGWHTENRRVVTALSMLLVFVGGALLNAHPILSGMLSILIGGMVAALLDWLADDVQFRWLSWFGSDGSNSKDAVSAIWQKVLDSEDMRTLPVLILVGGEDIDRASILNQMSGETTSASVLTGNDYALWNVPKVCWVFESKAGLSPTSTGGQLALELLAGSPHVYRRGVVAGIVQAQRLADIGRAPGQRPQGAEQNPDASKINKTEVEFLREALISERVQRHVKASKGVRVPVFLAVTRCEEVSGFAEAFEALGRRGGGGDHRRSLGLWLQEGEEVGNVLPRFREHVTALVVEHMGETNTHPEQVLTDLDFIAQFGAAISGISFWLKLLVHGPKNDDRAPQVRVTGLFFGLTSGTDGKPNDSSAGSLVDLANYSIPIEKQKLKVAGRSDSGIGLMQPLRTFLETTNDRRSPEWAREVVERHWWIPVVASLTALGLFVISWSGQREIIEGVAGAYNHSVELSRRPDLNQTGTIARVRQVDALRAITALTLEQHRGNRTGMRVVYDDSSQTFPIARRIYVDTFRRSVGDALVEYARNTLRFCNATSPACTESRNLYGILTRAEGEDRLQTEGENAVATLERQWVALLERDGKIPAQSLRVTLHSNAALLIDLISVSNADLAQRDEALWRRGRLRRSSGPQGDARGVSPQGQMYEAALAEVMNSARTAIESNRCSAPLAVGDVLLTDRPPLEYSGCMWRGVTRGALEQSMRSADEALHGRDPVALERVSGNDRCRLVARSYARAHVGAWVGFLSRVQVRRPSGVGGAVELLRSLGSDSPEAPSPLRSLFSFVVERADASMSEAADAGEVSVLERVRGLASASRNSSPNCLDEAISVVRQDLSPVRQLLTPSGAQPDKLREYDESLIRVEQAMLAVKERPGDPGLQTQLTQSLAAAESGLTAYFGASNSSCAIQVRRILSAPLDLVRAQTRQARRESIESSWSSRVVPEYRRVVRDGPLGARPSSLADLKAFFGDQGTLHRFIENDMRDMLVSDALDYRERPGEEGAVDPSFLQYIRKVAPLMRWLSVPQSGSLIFEVRRTDLDNSQIIVDGQAPISMNDSAALVWPVPSPHPGGEISEAVDGGRRVLLSKTGEWGWIRLLREGRITHRSGSGRFDVVWRVQGRDVRMSVLCSGGADVLFGAGRTADFPGLLNLPEVPRVVTRDASARR